MSDRELTLTMTLDAPRSIVWRCWTEPELMTQWFTPRPWTTPHVETDVRPGGASLVVMRDPDGNEHPQRGVYLEVVPQQRLVFTDAYTDAWSPSEKPFMTAELTFQDAGPGKTKYTAVVKHWSAADCEQHRKMGFEPGWTAAANQLVEVAKRLSGA